MRGTEGGCQLFRGGQAAPPRGEGMSILPGVTRCSSNRLLASQPGLEGLFGEGACSVCYFGITLRCLGLRREAESFSSLPLAGWEISLWRALPSLPQLLSEKSSRHCAQVCIGECD